MQAFFSPNVRQVDFCSEKNAPRALLFQSSKISFMPLSVLVAITHHLAIFSKYRVQDDLLSWRVVSHHSTRREETGKLGVTQLNICKIELSEKFGSYCPSDNGYPPVVCGSEPTMARMQPNVLRSIRDPQQNVL